MSKKRYLRCQLNWALYARQTGAVADAPADPLEQSLHAMLVAALALLVEYLVDEDVAVIRSAQYTLRQLLTLPEGAEALRALDPVSQSYIQVRHLHLLAPPRLMAL